MPVPLAPHVTLGCEEQSQLESIVRAHSTPQALAFRCRLLLRTAAPDRPSHLQVAQELHCNPPFRTQALMPVSFYRSNHAYRWPRSCRKFQCSSVRVLTIDGCPRIYRT